MINSNTITQSGMRGINRSAILDLIRRKGPISRYEVAKALGLSLPTIGRIIDQLIEDSLVRVNEKEWSGGRRRSRLCFNGEGRAIIGVDLGGPYTYGAVVTLGGSLLHEYALEQTASTAEGHYRQLVRVIKRLLSHMDDRSHSILLGIGVGIPGVTKIVEQEVLTWVPRLKWQDFPLKFRLENELDLHVSVENDINLAALGELWFGAGQNERNLVLLSVGSGTGAGIIIDGALYRGSRHFAGEVGYIVPELHSFNEDHLEFGALESIASESGLLKRVREILKDRLSPEELDALKTDLVFREFQNGEDWAREVVEETVGYLAIAASNLAAILDPDVIVLGGSMARFAELLVPPILSRLQKVLPFVPKFVPSSLEQNAVIMGTVANVLLSTDDFYLVRKLP